MTSLRITEIFCSLQGESSLVGLPTVFVRLTGCPLRCGYCDTAYAFKGGESLELEIILDRVAAFGVQHVTVTGGEPLAQTSCHALLVALCDAGYRVSLETSGALDVAEVDSRVKRVMDIKTPSSGEVDRNLWSNLKLLVPDDEVKFVIGDRDDYEWSKGVVSEYSLASRCGVLFSPVYGVLEARTLADWIVEDRLPVRFQIQLHKLLWGDRPGV
ncbi:MAG: 7-carboxy-7-deazaguanine synthase QueE [Chromatiales bacterium]|jgi:7-carboxy-7-deazaguanine synthase